MEVREEMYFTHKKERVPIENVMRGSRCCVCLENVPNLHRNNLTAFKFPVKRPLALEQWRKFAKLPPKGVDFTKFIMCSKHFREEDIKRQCFRTVPKLFASPHLFPPETVLEFPGVKWNPEEETETENEGVGEAAILSLDDEEKYYPNAVITVSKSSVYKPEHKSADESDETSMSQTFDAELPKKLDPLYDVNDITFSYDPSAVKTYPSKAILERKQLLVKMKSELCRICARKEEVLSPIFSEDVSDDGDELTLAKKLDMYLPLEINAEEDLPMSICVKCHELVLSWHELYVACLAADCVLREIFGADKVDKCVSGLHAEEQEKYCEEQEKYCEEEEEVEVVRYVERKKKTRCKEERQAERKLEMEETIFEDLGTVYEEVETTCDGETKCEDVEMRLEKENNKGQDTLHNTDDPLDDVISLCFKKQPIIKCYSTKRGVAEIREMSICPEEEFGSKDKSVAEIKKSKRALKFGKICKRHWEGVEENITGSPYLQVAWNRPVASQNARKPLTGYMGDCESIVRQKRNIREGVAKSPTVVMKPLTCSHCNTIFTEWEEYNIHKTKCRLEPTVCEECGATISQRCYLKKHIKTHFLAPKGLQKKPPPPLNCEWCDKMFKSRFALRCHLDAFHNGEDGKKEPTNYCEPCCKVFISNISYKVHMKQHEDGKVKNCVNLELIAADGDSSELSYNCPVCAMSFPDKMQLIIHMNAVNVKKCPKCRVRMSSERFTLIHKCKYWYCRFCNKQFYNKNRYQIHERVHTRERPYMCHICGKKFVSSESLFTHKKGHGKPAFECEQCGKLFKKKVLYNMHMDSHAGKHYTCFYCSKNFIYQNNLSKHCKKAHSDLLNAGI